MYMIDMARDSSGLQGSLVMEVVNASALRVDGHHGKLVGINNRGMSVSRKKQKRR